MIARRLLDGAVQVLRVVPLEVLSRLIRRDAVGFCYHVIADGTLPHLRHLYAFKSPSEFEADLEFLQEHYQLLSYADLCERHHSRADGHRPQGVLTFDDGLKECFTIIRPLLLKYSIPAIFFVTTGFLDNQRLFYRHKASLCVDAYLRLSAGDAAAFRRELEHQTNATINDPAGLPGRILGMMARDEPLLDLLCERLGVDAAGFLSKETPYLTSDQVRALARDGFVIGAHGIAHAHIGSLTTEEAEMDIVGSCTTVERLVGSSPVPYALPFNGHGVSRAMLRELRARYSTIGLIFDTDQLAVDESFVFNRISVDGPSRVSSRESNLPQYLRRAYAIEMAQTVKRWCRLPAG